MYLFDLALCYQEDIGDMLASAAAKNLTDDDLRKIAADLADTTDFIAQKIGRKDVGRVADAVMRFAESVRPQAAKAKKKPARRKTAR